VPRRPKIESAVRPESEPEAAIFDFCSEIRQIIGENFGSVAVLAKQLQSNVELRNRLEIQGRPVNLSYTSMQRLLDHRVGNRNPGAWVTMDAMLRACGEADLDGWRQRFRKVFRLTPAGSGEPTTAAGMSDSAPSVVALPPDVAASDPPPWRQGPSLTIQERGAVTEAGRFRQKYDNELAQIRYQQMPHGSLLDTLRAARQRGALEPDISEFLFATAVQQGHTMDEWRLPADRLTASAAILLARIAVAHHHDEASGRANDELRRFPEALRRPAMREATEERAKLRERVRLTEHQVEEQLAELRWRRDSYIKSDSTVAYKHLADVPQLDAALSLVPEDPVPDDPDRLGFLDEQLAAFLLASAVHHRYDVAIWANVAGGSEAAAQSLVTLVLGQFIEPAIRAAAELARFPKNVRTEVTAKAREATTYSADRELLDAVAKQRVLQYVRTAQDPRLKGAKRSECEKAIVDRVTS
jgi:hypothetical protein